jgi:predicted nucleotidyltransferase
MLHNKYYEIMKLFLEGYFKEVYGAELSRSSALSQKNIALTLIELEKQGILLCKTRGNRKYYSINFANVLIKDYLVLFELQRKIKFLDKYKKLVDLVEEINGDIAGIFGSFAKERNVKNSDLDVFVVGKVNSCELTKKAREFGVKIQIFNFSFRDFKKAVFKKNVLIQEILNAHVLLKGHDAFVEVIVNGKN